MAWEDYIDDVGVGTLSGAASGAAIGSVVPVIGTGIGAAAGGLIGGVSGWWDQYSRNKNKGSAENLIKRFNQGGQSSSISPALMRRARLLAGGGHQGQGGVSYDTDFASQLIRGDIPQSVASALDRRIGSRFDTLRRNQGGQLARSGVLNSSIGGRLMGDTYDSERNALTDSYMNTLMQRQQFGLNLLGAADMSQGRQADRDLASQQLGFNVLSNADRQRFARETFGVNAQLGLLGQQQARRDSSLESSGNILGNLYTNYRDDQRFNQQLAQQNSQFSQLLGLSQGGGNSPIQAKAQLSAVQLGGGNILGSRDPFKLLSESRTGAGGYGSRNSPLTSRY